MLTMLKDFSPENILHSLYCTLILPYIKLVDSLKINSLPLNIFSATEVSAKMASTLFRKWFKKQFSVKSLKFCIFLTLRFGSNFASMWSKHASNTVWRDFRLPVSAFAAVARTSFNGKFTAKINFPIGHFMLPLLTLNTL